MAIPPIDHPQVRALLFFHAARDSTVTAQPVDWSFDNDPALVDVTRGALSQDAPTK